MRIVALTVLCLAVVALVTGNLDRFFPTSRFVEYRSNSAESLHSGIRAAVVIIAVAAVATAAIVAYLY